MERVMGIGGIFFKATDKVALCAWYRDNLGVPVEEWGARTSLGGRTIHRAHSGDRGLAEWRSGLLRGSNIRTGSLLRDTPDEGPGH
jgi:hypothetical protein